MNPIYTSTYQLNVSNCLLIIKYHFNIFCTHTKQLTTFRKKNLNSLAFEASSILRQVEKFSSFGAEFQSTFMLSRPTI